LSKSKIIFLSLFFAVTAELLLIFIIYFNPYKISAIYDPEIQVWINALFNALSAATLLFAYRLIKRGRIKAHIIAVHIALLFSALFLVNYIFYHMSVGHVVFHHPTLRPIYLTLLISHLVCSVICLPMIFITYGLGITRRLAESKKLAMITFIMWEFVSVSGVMIVFFLKLLNTGP
jgi:uncharacterized membrane protein YozB (DUF420 family)